MRIPPLVVVNREDLERWIWSEQKCRLTKKIVGKPVVVLGPNDRPICLQPGVNDSPG